MTNDSELPTRLSFKIDKRLSFVTFSAEDLGKIIEGLGPNQPHGHANISIYMIK